MRRHKLVKDILSHGKKIKCNITTLVFLMATMSDKALTKFHKEFLEKHKDAKIKA